MNRLTHVPGVIVHNSLVHVILRLKVNVHISLKHTTIQKSGASKI